MPERWPHTIGGDGLLRVNRLRDLLTGAVVNDATLEVLYVGDEVTGQPLAGVTPPVAMSYVASSQGNYYGTLANTLAVKPGQNFYVLMRATDDMGLIGMLPLYAVGVGVTPP